MLLLSHKNMFFGVILLILSNQCLKQGLEILNLMFSHYAVIPYHFTLSTGIDRDASTTARVYVIIIGPKDAETDRLWLDLAEGKKSFAAGSMEHFVCYGADVGEIKRVEVRIWDCVCS